MKWDGDKYQEMKWNMFDIMRKELDLEDASRITIRMLSDAIDEMVYKLINPEKKND